MPLETVVFSAGVHASCSLTANAEQAVRNASFDIPWSGPGLPCHPGDAATIMVSGELWATGYVRQVSARHDAFSRSYDVSFVSRTVDATECSVDHATGLKRNADLMAIIKEFDTLGIGVEGTAKTQTKARHKVWPGETLFETIENDARANGVLIHDTPTGKLKLADRQEGSHSGGLTRGVNIIAASGTLTEQGRFSSVKVRGQATEGVKSTALRPEAEAQDSGVRRKRPRIVLLEGEATSERLKKRAKWEAQRGAGNGTSATIETPGWRDAGGKLWTRNYLVRVDDDWLGISQMMVIAAVTLRQDAEGGTTASLSLKDPRALGGSASGGGGWAAPGAAEPTYREE